MDFPERIRGRAALRRRGVYLAERLGKSLCFVQGDQNIANQAGAAFRSDLNNELQALVTNSQGNSAPSTIYRNQFWHDTTTNTIKRRNAANSAWIVVDSLDETFVVARTSNTILGLSDCRKTISASTTFTQTLAAAATLGDGWWIRYRNNGTGVITLDPNASETIDGAATLELYPGESCIIACDGSTFQTVGRQSTGNIKVGSFTRDISTASGSQAITGVGFKPKAVIFLAGDTSAASSCSAGFDTAAASGSLVNNENASATTWSIVAGASIGLIKSVNDSANAHISSMDTDGFTLTWNKINLPTGTFTIYYIALR